MTAQNKNWTRRDFMKIAGAAGVGAVVSPMERLAEAAAKSKADAPGGGNVAKRPFGKTGVDVSILSLGGGAELYVESAVIEAGPDAGCDLLGFVAQLYRR